MGGGIFENIFRGSVDHIINRDYTADRRSCIYYRQACDGCVQTNQSTAPVLLWLNGGPGRTSLVGALLENGPLEVTLDGKGSD